MSTVQALSTLPQADKDRVIGAHNLAYLNASQAMQTHMEGGRTWSQVAMGSTVLLVACVVTQFFPVLAAIENPLTPFMPVVVALAFGTTFYALFKTSLPFDGNFVTPELVVVQGDQAKLEAANAQLANFAAKIPPIEAKVKELKNMVSEDDSSDEDPAEIKLEERLEKLLIELATIQSSVEEIIDSRDAMLAAQEEAQRAFAASTAKLGSPKKGGSRSPHATLGAASTTASVVTASPTESTGAPSDPI